MRGLTAALLLAVLLVACGDGERAAFVEAKCRAFVELESAYEGCVEVAGRAYDELKRRRSRSSSFRSR